MYVMHSLHAGMFMHIITCPHASACLRSPRFVAAMYIGMQASLSFRARARAHTLGHLQVVEEPLNCLVFDSPRFMQHLVVLLQLVDDAPLRLDYLLRPLRLRCPASTHTRALVVFG